MIPLFKVHMPEEVKDPLNEVLMSGYIGQGPKVDEFEKELEEWTGSQQGLTVNACTSAIHLALRLAGVGPGTDVITTPMTCTATNEPILERGANIIWADINPMTGCIDPKDVARKMTDKTKAVMCVHWAGYPCDLDELNEIAHANGAYVIEDAAHAFGSEYRGRPVGSISDFTCFSFQAIKHITTGDGGLLTCADQEHHHRGKLLRWYGINREDRSGFRCEPDISEYGYKFHMNDINATIGLAQLPYAEWIVGSHKNNAAHYDAEFAGLRRVELLNYQKDRAAAYWVYSLLVDDKESFTKHMNEAGVMVSPVHKRNDLHTMMKQFNRGPLPGVDEFERRQVSIPVGWWLSDGDIEIITNAVKEWGK